MKKLILPAIAAFTFISVASTAQTVPSGFPFPTGTKQDHPRKNRDVIVDQDGRVISKDGRVIGNRKNLPPGQAKKIYGDKSAKRHAPGQQKKSRNDDWYAKEDRRVRTDRDIDGVRERRDDIDYYKQDKKAKKGKGKNKK